MEAKDLIMLYTIGGRRIRSVQDKRPTQRGITSENRQTITFTGNLMKLGLISVVTLMRSTGQCMGTSFDLGASSYDCSSTLHCSGDAHQYIKNPNGSINDNADGKFAGKLSLIEESSALISRSGIAYYNQSIRMLDRSKNLAASFNTTFAFAEIVGFWNQSSGDYKSGDGITFVVSSNNSSVGSAGQALGYFDYDGKDKNNKSVVVEFDSFVNVWDPSIANDINGNHVAFDIGSLLSANSQPADKVGIELWQPSTVHAWIEYRADSQQLELRITNTSSRPKYPLLFYKMDPFEVFDEHMWVGFSGSTGDQWSLYYVWNWTFESNFATPPPPPPSPQSRDTGKLVLGLSVGLPVSVAVIGGCCFFVLARRRHSRQQDSATDDLTSKLASMTEGYRFTYEQLDAATGGFSESAKLGRGGFGSVYRGVLPVVDAPIAVKRIDADSSQGEKEFMAEVSAISQLRHRNLIQLLGWCTDRGQFMIVYELMLHGSLNQHLFKPGNAALSWSQRHNILRGTAAAIDYLHQGWRQRVIHRDIKASNIMLDDEWNAKLGDFGLARLVDHLRTTPTTGIAGTAGYLAPEAATLGKFTENTDTFAFGVVAMEIATGRKTLTLQAPEEEIILVDWVWQRLTEGRLLSVVDERLGVDYDIQSMEVVLRMGLLCCHPDRLARPPMRQVVQVLAGDVPMPSVPLSKPVSVFRTMKSHSSHTRHLSFTARKHSTDISRTDSNTARVPSSNADLRHDDRTFHIQRSQSQR